MHAWHTKNGTKRDVNIRPKFTFPAICPWPGSSVMIMMSTMLKPSWQKMQQKWVVEQITMLCILASPLQRKDWGEADLKNLTQIQIQKQVQIQIQTFEMVENFQ